MALYPLGAMPLSESDSSWAAIMNQNQTSLEPEFHEKTPKYSCTFA